MATRPDAQMLLSSYRLGEDDLREIRELGRDMSVDDLVETFYTWLEDRPEFTEFFSDRQILERVKRQQRIYWQQFLDARVDDDYIDSRLLVGKVHARIKLGIHTYFAALAFCVDWLSEAVRRAGQPAEIAETRTGALTRLAQLDGAVVIDAISEEYGQIIAQQSRSLMELSTPAIKLWDDILLLPLVGVIDSQRATQVMEGLLSSIVETESRIAILDVTGVPVIDTYVAQHLIQAVNASRMLGAEVILTGFSPEAAQALIRLRVDLSRIRTAGSLRAGLALAFRDTGWKISKDGRGE